MDLASAGNVQAELLRLTGRLDEALAAFTEARSLAQSPVQKDPTFLQPRSVIADAWTGIGEIHVTRRQYEPARGAFEKALQERKVIAEREPAWPDNRRQQATLYRSLGQAESALSGARSEAACRWYGLSSDLLGALRRDHVEPVPTQADVDALAKDQDACGTTPVATAQRKP